MGLQIPGARRRPLFTVFAQQYFTHYLHLWKLLYNIFMHQETEARFPIRELARRTGVNASTLRAWETRHGLLEPARTESGHRLYSEWDVRRVRRLIDLIAQGYSLASLGDMVDSALEPEARLAQSRPHLRSLTQAADWAGYIEETLRAIEDFSSERLDKLYNEACGLYPIDLLTRRLLIPVLVSLGERWHARKTGVAEEHFFSAWLRNKLGARLHHSAGQPRGRLLVLACIHGEVHEIGLLLFALSALQRGYRVIYLGANMPTRQVTHVAERARAAAIVLAGGDLVNAEAAVADIAWLVGTGTTPVFVGSHFATQARERLLNAGAIPLGSDIDAGLDILDKRLAKHQPKRRESWAR